MLTDAVTYFHVPDCEASLQYVPGRSGQSSHFGGSIEGHVFPPPGTLITLHGDNRTFRVRELQFHVGHPDELEGVHVILEVDTSVKKVKKGVPADLGSGLQSLEGIPLPKI